MHKPAFAVVDLGGGCRVINDGRRTVALITSQGYIDWLLRSPRQHGPLLTSIRKETHLSYTLGLKLLLTTPTPATELKQLHVDVDSVAGTVTLIGVAHSKDGSFRSDTHAELHVDAETGQYEWILETVLTCTAAQPVALSWVEFNNVYPGKCGRCFLYAQEKEYHSTLMVDRGGMVWEFPHQHLLHYSAKIRQLEFAPGTLAGFFGEEYSPVVVVRESSLPPDWAICDMYYDLHCGARPTGPLAPGEHWRFAYTVKWLTPTASRPYIRAARPVPITPEDRERHHYPRLELGMNHFDSPVNVAAYDDASGFRQAPPARVWDRDMGHSTKGSLRLTNAATGLNVWSAEPPTQIPPGRSFRLAAMVRTAGVEGRGLYVRVRYHTFVWHPTPHVEWVKTLETPAVSGTTPAWVAVSLPELIVPEEEFDYLIWVDVVLEGKGVAWLTDMDVELVPVGKLAPAR